MTKTKAKRKINIKGLLFLLLIFYLIGCFIYYIFTMPIKNIIVSGNYYVDDLTIIKKAGLESYPNIFKVSVLKIKTSLKEDAFINTVEVKKNIFGKITIMVTENKPLFINKLSNKLVLANNRTVDYNNDYLGMPILINYTPNSIYDDLIEGLAKIDDDIINKISEIEYTPDKSGEIIFDDNRFLLKMNDGNLVYINTPNIKKLNNYKAIYSKVGNSGILYLDSSSENYIFKK